MRIIIHIDTFDRVSPCGYAIVEINKEGRRWVLSSQCGMSLPAAGTLVAAANGTFVCALAGARHLCLLEGLDAFATEWPFEGETGAAMWYADLGIQPVPGHWHVEIAEKPGALPLRSDAEKATR